MHTKAELPLRLLAKDNLVPETFSPLLEAYFEFNHLKQLFRQGWLKRGVPVESCESVAEHSFSTAVLAVFLADAYFTGLDTCKVVRMALLHDFGEVYAGDFTPSDRVAVEEKHRLEREGVVQIFAKLPQGKAYIDLWDEYEAGETREARLVRQLDRLEMGLQACVYKLQGKVDPAEFYETVRQSLTTAEIQALFDELQKL